MVCMDSARPQNENVVINSVTLTGNDNVSMNEILYIIRLRPPNWFFRRPGFDSRLVKLDALTLKSYYHSKGYLDVKVNESYTIVNNSADIVYHLSLIHI